MSRFNDYINIRQQNWLEFVLDEGEGQQFGGQKFPIPMNLALLLSLVPGGPQFQGQALKYIMTDALYKAAVGRKKLAEAMSQKLGRTVREYEVFSPQIHAEDPQVQQEWEAMKDEYFQKYEPKNIRINYGNNIGDLYLSIPKLNNVLEQHGLPPFQFGGPKGFIELMESGRGWVKDRPSIDPAYGEGEAHQRFGIDLSHPRLVRYSDRPYEPRVAFGHSPNIDSDKRSYREPGWEPSLSTTYYTERLNQWMRRNSDKAERLMQSIPDGDPQKEQLSQIFNTIGKGFTRSSQAIEDDTFNNKSADKVYFDDTNAYRRAKLTVLKALRAFNSLPDEKRVHVDRAGNAKVLDKLSREDVKLMLNKFFNDEEMSVQQRVSGFPPWKKIGKGSDKLLVSMLQNWLHYQTTQTPKRPSGVNPYRGAFNPVTVGSDIGGMDDVFEKPIMDKQSIEGGLSPEILKQMFPDYFPLDHTEGNLEKRIASGLPFVLTNGEDEISFSFDKKSNKWFTNKPTGKTEKHPKFNWSKYVKSPVVLPGNDEVGYLKPHQFDYIPLYGPARQKRINTWDQFAKQLGKDRAEEANIAKAVAAKIIGGRTGMQDMDAYRDEVGDAFEAFESLLGSPKFFYGEPGKHYAELLQKHDYDPHEAEGIAKEAKQLLASGQIPTADNFHPEDPKVYQLLLRNGQSWRINAAANIIAGNIAQVKKLRGRERTGVGGANKEGEQTDVMAQAATNAAAERRAAGGDVEMTKGKLDRYVSGRSVIGKSGSDTATVTQAQVGGTTELYKREGQAMLPPEQVEEFNDLYDYFYATFQPMFRPNKPEEIAAMNAQINKVQGAYQNSELVRAAGNASVMDVVHDAVQSYIKTKDQDSSKRALAQTLYYLFANRSGDNLKDMLADGDLETPEVDTAPLISQVQPLIMRDKVLAQYFQMLQRGETIDRSSPDEEKPGLKVVGKPTQAPAKPTFGGTSGGGLRTTNMPVTNFTYGGVEYTPSQFAAQYQGFDRETIEDAIPVNTWSELPDQVRQQLKAYYDKMNMTGLQKAESLISIDNFLSMLKETDAIFDGSKPTTFNWWGAVGDPLGKVIDGDVPVKKKKKNAKR